MSVLIFLYSCINLLLCRLVKPMLAVFSDCCVNNVTDATNVVILVSLERYSLHLLMLQDTENCFKQYCIFQSVFLLCTFLRTWQQQQFCTTIYNILYKNIYSVTFCFSLLSSTVILTFTSLLACHQNKQESNNSRIGAHGSGQPSLSPRMLTGCLEETMMGNVATDQTR